MLQIMLNGTHLALHGTDHTMFYSNASDHRMFSSVLVLALFHQFLGMQLLGVIPLAPPAWCMCMVIDLGTGKQALTVGCCMQIATEQL